MKHAQMMSARPWRIAARVTVLLVAVALLVVFRLDDLSSWHGSTSARASAPVRFALPLIDGAVREIGTSRSGADNATTTLAKVLAGSPVPYVALVFGSGS